jgi:hypothetical protein
MTVIDNIRGIPVSQETPPAGQSIQQPGNEAALMIVEREVVREGAGSR